MDQAVRGKSGSFVSVMVYTITGPHKNKNLMGSSIFHKLLFIPKIIWLFFNLGHILSIVSFCQIMTNSCTICLFFFILLDFHSVAKFCNFPLYFDLLNILSDVFRYFKYTVQITLNLARFSCQLTSLILWTCLNTRMSENSHSLSSVTSQVAI